MTTGVQRLGQYTGVLECVCYQDPPVCLAIYFGKFPLDHQLTVPHSLLNDNCELSVEDLQGVHVVNKHQSQGSAPLDSLFSVYCLGWLINWLSCAPSQSRMLIFNATISWLELFQQGLQTVFTHEH